MEAATESKYAKRVAFAFPPSDAKRALYPRILALLLGVAISVSMFWMKAPVDPSANRLDDYLLAAGLATICGIMAIHWDRLPGLRHSMERPGRVLSFWSKLLGWGGLLLVPSFIVAEDWLAVAVLSFMAVISLFLWLRHEWAIVAWYLPPLALGIYCGFSVYSDLSERLPASFETWDREMTLFVGAVVFHSLLILGAVKLVIDSWRIVRMWHMHVTGEQLLR